MERCKQHFIHKLRIVLKELKECRIILKIIRKKGLIVKITLVDDCSQETEELISIIAKSIVAAERNRV